MADYNGIEPLLNTIDGMECIVNNVGHDDDVVSCAGVDWFNFNNVAAATMYASGNTFIGIGTNAEHLKVCRRDAKMWYLYRQEGTIFGYLRFFKLRWQGYAYYSSTDISYALKYELFLFDDGRMFLNVIQTPTNTSYLGTSALVCGSNTYPLTIGTNDTCPVYYTFTPTDETGAAWTVANEMIVIAPPTKKLIRAGGVLYTVQDGVLVELPREIGEIVVNPCGQGTAWINVNTNVICLTDGKATSYSYPITPGTEYTITVTEKPDRWRIATSETDSALLQAGESIPIVRVLDNKTAVPAVGYTLTFTAQENENFVCLHLSATNLEYTEKVAYQGETPLSQLFVEYGMDDAPSSAILTTLVNPAVLAWTDGEIPPMLTATVTGAPYTQTIETLVDMTNTTIKGIASMTANYTGNVGVQYSVDEKATFTEEMTVADFLNIDKNALFAAASATRRMWLDFIIHAGGKLTEFQIKFKN